MDAGSMAVLWLLLATVALLVALAWFSWRRRSVPGAVPFAVGCVFTALWAAGSFMEYAVADVATKIFWVKFQSVWQLPATTAITCFILEYVWPGRWLTRRNLALLSIVPLLILALALTNDFHHLMWIGFTYDGSVLPLRGPSAWVLLVYAYAVGIANILLVAWLFLRWPQYRWPMAMVLISQVGARAVYLLEKAYVVRTDLPLDILGVLVVFVAWAIVLFGFRILDPVPLARQAVIAQMRDGLLVLNAQGRVASLNPAAQAILGAPAETVLGQPVQDLLPMVQDADGGGLAAGTEPIELRLGTEPQARDYLLETSTLKDVRGLTVGRLLLLRDITERTQAQAQIVEQQRALAMLQEREQLARELHDSLGQAFAFVNTQGQTVRRLLSRGDVATADELVGRLVEVAREADVDIRESILGLRETLSERGLFPALAHYLKQYEKNYGVHTELIVPDILTDTAFEQQVEVQLLRIVQEALTNVRKHARAGYVRVVFTADAGRARVTVQDDGQGFDPGTGGDGSAEHVGLRVMRERAEGVGGTVRVDSAPGQGTCVTVDVPMGGETRGQRDAEMGRGEDRETRR
jgi:signal transduction histidine kinase